jgi:hypothetical protein
MLSSLRLCRVTRENSSDLVRYAREFADAGESGFVLPGNDPEAFLARVEIFEAGKDLTGC